jgi:sulfatase modifying factor 1
MSAHQFRSLILCLTIAACSTSQSPAEPITWTEPETGMTFRRIEPGVFLMGSRATEAGREAQEQQHSVRLTRPFWIAVYEVTQSEWQEIMGTNPSHWRDETGRLPVEEVSWFEVRDFLTRLESRAPGNRFRLPTEAEWEYACRAGTSTPFGTGESLAPTDANYATSAERAAAGEGRTMAVGSFKPNAWGLHDMHGNVWEWTGDEHCAYGTDPATDPRPSCGGSLKVIRGGSWYFGADSARCALRYTHRPQDRGFSLGFRVVREPAL